MVYLIGAGPGDPGLITVKALETLRRADVVLYDRLADTSLLAETKKGCLLVDVGKSAGNHTRPQDETTALLAEYGRSHDTVVRLKGGDPFLFGRGGEEAEHLAEEGIPFTVIPGVSALTAATASAGIPLTHRDCASSFGVATGHGAKGKDADPVRWRRLAEAVDTIVVFMGIGTIGAITRELIRGGRDGATPAAVIENGASPSQRVVTGTLATIAETVEKERIRPPALLVVSPTVNYHDKLAWFASGPLRGLRIGITRPLSQSSSFAGDLVRQGARPFLIPVIAIEQTVDSPEVVQALRTVSTYDYIIFSSVNGVESFFRALNQHGADCRALAGILLACIGPVTGQALERFGVRADIVAERYVAEGLAEAVTGSDPVAGKRMLLVRSNIGRRTLSEELAAEGALPDEVVFYRTVREELSDFNRALIQEGGVDCLTFTSSSTVDNLFGQLGADGIPDTVKCASIGPQTSERLRSHGREPDIEAAIYTTAGLRDAILAHYRGNPD